MLAMEDFLAETPSSSPDLQMEDFLVDGSDEGMDVRDLAGAHTAVMSICPDVDTMSLASSELSENDPSRTAYSDELVQMSGVETSEPSEVSDDDSGCLEIGQTMCQHRRGIHAAFRGFFIACCALEAVLGHEALCRSWPSRQGTFGSNCSGIGCAEVASAMLTNAVRGAASLPFGLLGASLCEINLGCRKHLLVHVASNDGCLFKDMKEPFPDLPKDEDLMAMDLETRFRCIQSKFKPRWSRPCQSHRGWCGTPCLEGDVTGSPCQPWSRGGKRKGWTDARSIVTLLWLASFLTCRPTWAIHENVPGFDSQFLARKAAQWYHVFDLVVRPADMGFPIRRQRLYTVFISKTATLLADPKNLYRAICNAVKQDGISAEISDCFTADVELILQLENAERSKRNLHKLDTPSSCWQYLLSKGERERLQYYIVAGLPIINHFVFHQGELKIFLHNIFFWIC